jgi:hypothetical protein
MMINTWKPGMRKPKQGRIGAECIENIREYFSGKIDAKALIRRSQKLMKKVSA